MLITMPSEIQQVAWEGELEAPAETMQYKGFGPGECDARVSVGRPEEFRPEQALEAKTGEKWKPPLGDRKYTLVRLACNLYPPTDPRTRYDRAILQVLLRPRQGMGVAIAQELYPLRLGVEEKVTRTIGLGPDLKFGAAEFKAAEVGAELEFTKTFAVIEGFGLGESDPYWQFTYHSAHPLLGIQRVYLVLAAPRDANGVRLSADLTAMLQTRYGPLRVGLPREARDSLVWTVGA